jgi:hypothetical protein
MILNMRHVGVVPYDMLGVCIITVTMADGFLVRRRQTSFSGGMRIDFHIHSIMELTTAGHCFIGLIIILCLSVNRVKTEGSSLHLN